jgi:hypothetical protein
MGKSGRGDKLGSCPKSQTTKIVKESGFCMSEKLRYYDQVEKNEKSSLIWHLLQRVFGVALSGKIREKLDVATSIVTGFSLRVTLARHGVGFVYLPYTKRFISNKIEGIYADSVICPVILLCSVSFCIFGTSHCSRGYKKIH